MMLGDFFTSVDGRGDSTTSYIMDGARLIDPGLIFFHRSPRPGGLSVPEVAGFLKRGPGGGGGGTDIKDYLSFYFL